MSESSSQIDHFWTTVSSNPTDFSSWEQLIQLTEESGDKTKISHVYTLFLKQFPLCFGYWKKYADWEEKLTGVEAAEKIYRSAFKSIKNSVDLWTNYCQFKMKHFSSNTETIRKVLEEAADAIGLDFMSHSFWDVYIEYEENTIRDYEQVVRILERVIRIPLHQYARYFEKYTQLSVTRPVRDLVSEREYTSLESQVKAEQETSGQIKSLEQLETILRKKIHQLKSDVYMKTQESVSKRWTFESEIKRSYFHVQPLTEAELANWNSYLDFEESELALACDDQQQLLEQKQRITFLYERCLVPCAYYEEMWMRYVSFLLSQSSQDIQEKVKHVFTTATGIYLTKRKYQLRLAFASFEEEHNRVEEAKKILDDLLESLPGHADTLAHYAHLLKRHDGISNAIDFIKTHLKVLTDENNTDNREARIVLSVLKLKFEYQHQVVSKSKGYIETARKSYQRLLEESADSLYVALNYLAFESKLIDYGNVDALLDAWNAIKTSSVSKKDIALIGSRILSLLQEYGTDASKFNLAHLYLEARASTEPISQSNMSASPSSALKRPYPVETSVDTAYATSMSKMPRTDMSSPYSAALATAGSTVGATGYYGYDPNAAMGWYQQGQ